MKQLNVAIKLLVIAPLYLRAHQDGEFGTQIINIVLPSTVLSIVLIFCQHCLFQLQDLVIWAHKEFTGVVEMLLDSCAEIS